jgi:threonine/homoserine/homoserine lactone efflux protein
MWFSDAGLALLTGVCSGLMVAAPIGPMGVLCIQRTLSAGVAGGLAAGLGAATVHLGYSAFIVLGLGALAQPWIAANVFLLRAISGISLIWFAIRIWRNDVRLPTTAEVIRSRFADTYLSAVVLGVANPLTIMLFFAVLHTSAAIPAVPAVMIGVFLGSVMWWTVLTTVVAAARSRLSKRRLEMSNKVASLILVGLGLAALSKSAIRALGYLT